MGIVIVANAGNKIKIEVDAEMDDMLKNWKMLTDKNFKIQSDSSGIKTAVNGSLRIYPNKGKLVFLLQPTEFR